MAAFDTIGAQAMADAGMTAEKIAHHFRVTQAEITNQVTFKRPETTNLLRFDGWPSRKAHQLHGKLLRVEGGL